VIYNNSEVRLVWKHFEAFPGDYPIFKIRHWYTALCEKEENPILENSCLSGTLKLVRRLSYYIIRYYLLTFLTVAISFVGFWVPINAWPARVSADVQIELKSKIILGYFAGNATVKLDYARHSNQQRNWGMSSLTFTRHS